MKLRLIVETGTLAGKEISLEAGSLTLGRGLEANLRFDATGDPGVSGKHASVFLEKDGFYIVDQNSTNGTFVDGERTQRVLLKPGSFIQLGYQGPRIKVLIEGAQQNSANLQDLSKNKSTLYWDENKQIPKKEPENITPISSNFSNPLLQPSLSAILPQEQNFNKNSSPLFESNSDPASSLKQSFSNIGIYNPEKEKTGNKMVASIAVVGIGFVMTVIVALIMLKSVGLGGAIVGTILAFTPAPFYLLLFLWLDRYDPEPAWALGGAFAWGGLFAVIVSFFVNTFFGAVATSVAGGPVGNLLGAVVSAPIIEEATKGLGVLLISIFLRKEFDDIVDGIVYAGVVALGFATVENVLYYGSQFTQSGFGVGLVVILFLRGVLSPFAHALFTSMTGIGCGIARETHNKTLKFLMPIAGYILAVFLHGLWNGAATIVAALFGGGAYFIFYLLIWVPLFLILLGVMIYMVHREAKLIKQMLAIEVARGLISPEQLELVGSSFARIKWLTTSLFSGDIKKFSAQRKFLRSVTKLAFCYWHVARANQANSQTQSLPQIPRFQSEVMMLKSQI